MREGWDEMPGNWLGTRFHLLALKAPQRKYLVYLVVLGALGLVLLFLGQTVSPRPAGPAGLLGENPGAGVTGGRAGLEGAGEENLQGMEDYLAAVLEKNLQKIAGAGQVRASVILDTGPLRTFERNENTVARETREEDTDGGTRTISDVTRDSQLALFRDAGGERPVVARVSRPEVRGVLVVASGARNSRVKAELSRAVEVMFNLPPHRVFVSPMEKGE